MAILMILFFYSCTVLKPSSDRVAQSITYMTDPQQTAAILRNQLDIDSLKQGRVYLSSDFKRDSLGNVWLGDTVRLHVIYSPDGLTVYGLKKVDSVIVDTLPSPERKIGTDWDYTLQSGNTDKSDSIWVRKHLDLLIDSLFRENDRLKKRVSQTATSTAPTWTTKVLSDSVRSMNKRMNDLIKDNISLHKTVDSLQGSLVTLDTADFINRNKVVSIKKKS